MLLCHITESAKGKKEIVEKEPKLYILLCSVLESRIVVIKIHKIFKILSSALQKIKSLFPLVPAKSCVKQVKTEISNTE